jgi:hypothetical protein
MVAGATLYRKRQHYTHRSMMAFDNSVFPTTFEPIDLFLIFADDVSSGKAGAWTEPGHPERLR